ncbi:MAG: hypothetical protein D5S00_10390 [Tindallia sp. MSAO_Bac2]|nr:MAG: hypothetical protein D5S00_10390 [Tindallia sp. MSAO_Bac2]
MRNTITTVLLILALAFVGAGLPLYMDSIDLDLDLSTDTPSPSSGEDPVYSLEHREISTLEHILEFEIDLTSFPEELHPTADELLEAELLYNNQQLRILDDEELNASVNFEASDNAYYLNGTLELMLEKLKVPDGTYTLQVRFLTAESENLIPPQDIELTFSSINTYESARWEPNPQTTPLRLYFPEGSYEQLIPITRFVPQTNTTLRETVTQLEQGPADELGLASGSPIPPVPRIQLSGGVTSLYLSSQLGEYNEDPALANNAAYSLVESLGSIPEVREIQFYFDNQVLAEGFTGLNTSERFYPSEGAAFYPVFVNNQGRALLYPVYTDNDNIMSLIERLQYDINDNMYNHIFQPSLPSDIALVDHELSGNTLTLIFNEAFEEFVNREPVRGRIMMDSILLTTGSLPEVSNVLLEINGSPISLPEEFGINTTSPIPVPLYINPEN